MTTTKNVVNKMAYVFKWRLNNLNFRSLFIHLVNKWQPEPYLPAPWFIVRVAREEELSHGSVQDFLVMQAACPSFLTQLIPALARSGPCKQISLVCLTLPGKSFAISTTSCLSLLHRVSLLGIGFSFVSPPRVSSLKEVHVARLMEKFRVFHAWMREAIAKQNN